ncbi:sugar nucleotide-binding protein [Sungkyunkwania multivorans]|uniref:dTDP-4-dehydrorhamnose reductase n=1 Tax=Sungkyunkwania multivorans TaxID=1173618 RepID=A0ABW3CWT8_9FLAO
MTRVLIIGASGFIGNALYKELCAYVDTYGTYFTNKSFVNNQHFFNFDVERDSIEDIVSKLRPTIIVSAIRGNFEAQISMHQYLCDYVKSHHCKVIFLSSANVFDAFTNYPSYEYDKTLSESIYGRLKIKIENMLMRLPQKKWSIVRLPMVFGVKSPRVKELKLHLENNIAYEVFPNLVMNVISDYKLTQQLHYIINRDLSGIYHLGSTDLVHHHDFIEELVESLRLKKPIYKNVYTSNFDRFLAVLPKDHKLPKHLQCSYQDVLRHLVK